MARAEKRKEAGPGQKPAIQRRRRPHCRLRWPGARKALATYTAISQMARLQVPNDPRPQYFFGCTHLVQCCPVRTEDQISRWCSRCVSLLLVPPRLHVINCLVANDQVIRSQPSPRRIEIQCGMLGRIESFPQFPDVVTISRPTRCQGTRRIRAWAVESVQYSTQLVTTKLERGRAEEEHPLEDPA